MYSRPGVILGVTNPFFAKTLQHWPHMVRIGEMSNLGEYFNQLDYAFELRKRKNTHTLSTFHWHTGKYCSKLKAFI